MGYSQVTESQADLTTGQSLGKTVYKYQIGDYSEYEDDIKNGDLLQQSTYRNDDKLLQEITSTYQYSFTFDIVAQIAKGSELQTNKNNYCKISTNNYYNYGNWENPDPSCITGPTSFFTKYYITNYTILLQNKQLTQQTQKIYDQLSNSYLTTTKNFTYGNAAHNYPTLIEETTANGNKIKSAIKYVVDYTGAPGAGSGTIAYNINYMQQKNMMGLPVEKLQYRQDANGSNTRYISGQLTDYITGNPSHIYFLEAQPLLTSVTGSSINSNTFNYDSHYRDAASMSYDNLMNLVQQSKTNDAPKSYIWDYNQMYPVAEVTGATSNQISYTSFESNGKGGFTFSGTPTGTSALTGTRYYDLTGSPIVGSTDPAKTYIISYWRNSNAGPFTVSGSSSYKQGATKNGWTYYEHTVSGVSTANISGNGFIDELRLYLSTAQMITTTYSPLIGITSQADVNNRILYYSYDGLSRLVNVKDDDGNIVKNFKYNYGLGAAPTASAQSIFYNALTQQDYTKAGCTAGTFGDVVTYKIPFGKHVSSVNQTDADAKATADKIANGQTYANSVGLCRWYNALRHVKIFKNNCLPEQGFGGFVWYDVPVGTFKSAVSQADADAMAQADVTANGQAYANANATCSCAAEGQRFINGVCETGQLYHGSSVQLPSGLWECGYYYTFSDSYVTGYYYYYSSSPCPIDP